MKKNRFLLIIILCFISINFLYSQSGLPCEEELAIPNDPGWSDPIDGDPVTVSSTVCPGCVISFKYKTRRYQMLGIWYTDLIITEYTTSNACNNCNINVFEYILWSIWTTNKDIWGLTALGCLENWRISAASCWRTTIGTQVEALPCSTTCCSSYYTVCLTNTNNVFFYIIDPFSFTDHCTISPCTHFVCDELSNINLTEQEADDIRNANPGFGLGKESLIKDSETNILILPNPASSTINIEGNNITCKSLQLKIYDMNGNEVYLRNFEIFNGYLKIDLDFNNLTTGSYLFTFSDGSNVVYSENIKIVK